MVASTALTPTITTRCGRTSKRSGQPCKHPAGHRTTHVGTGACFLHGGLQAGDGRLKYGRYSRRIRERFRDLIAEYEAVEDPLDLLPEIASLRALFVDYINRYDEFTEALLAWHASFGKDDSAAKPHKVLDIADASRILETVGKMVERVEMIRAKRIIGVVSPEVQERLRSQVTLIASRPTWEGPALLDALDAVWN